ncbi:hypothetical protein R1sor_006404 [Riccia sorocarpa]|uniref:Protein kinase domain-containing protein n=1 Tax=Riccia sorocarpa TaxID=122646 RepID=A0ABD3HMW4_9MARC
MLGAHHMFIRILFLSIDVDMRRVQVKDLEILATQPRRQLKPKNWQRRKQRGKLRKQHCSKGNPEEVAWPLKTGADKDLKGESALLDAMGHRILNESGVDAKPVHVRVFKFRELEEATHQFSERHLLGKGSHSSVYKGTLADGRVVAVKRPTAGRRGMQDTSSFDNELEIMSKLKHRHLVSLIGYSSETREKLLVMEYMANGSLYELLHCKPEPLSWPLRVRMILQAAKAVAALHSASPPIIHRDIKSSNILVDSSLNAKVGDLGLALRGHLEDVMQQRTPPAGTMGYMDPQYEAPAQLSTKSDVFSFGILLLEIISGRNAIDVRYTPSSILDWAVPLIKKGRTLALCDPALKPPQNSKAVKQLAAIAARCVRTSADRRPSMSEVVEGLRIIKRKVPMKRFGGKQFRTSVAAANPVVRVESPESLSASSSSSYKSQATCQSQGLSIFDDGSVIDDGEFSLAESFIRNHTVMRRRLRNLADISRISDLDLRVFGSSSYWRTEGVPRRSSFSGSTSYRTEFVDSLGVPGLPPRRATSQSESLRLSTPQVNHDKPKIALQVKGLSRSSSSRLGESSVGGSESQFVAARKSLNRRTLSERYPEPSVVVDSAFRRRSPWGVELPVAKA